MTTTLAPPTSSPDVTRTGPAHRHVPPTTPTPPHHARGVRRVVRGPSDEPAWARPALLGLLAVTAVLYLWDLSASGYGNSFYAAAAQAGSQSWKAWFFGSLDSGNSITVDKPPAALWIMGLSVRIFGLSSWSVLAPQAIEGVLSVTLLYGTVRRVAGPRAGLAAGAMLALTPAAVLMFRFDNPDALLTLLLVAAAYAVTRAVEAGSARWLMLCGTALGFAFLTKMLQGLLVLPVFALVYLIAAPTSLRRRIGHTLLGGLALLVSAGWWVLAVALWPASSRPYIGGSTNNSVLDLVFGYNGFGRLLGGDGNGGGGGGTAGSSFGGATGLTRLFSSEMGNEISWLLPAALTALVLGLAFTRRAPRTDRTRAALIVWGGWLLVTGLVFSFMKGTIHPYYTVALAPAVAATVAIGVTALWRRRDEIAARLGLAVVIVAAGGWSYVLLDRVSTWWPVLRYLVLAATVLGALAVLALHSRAVRRALVICGLLAGLVGTGSFAVATAASPHSGSIPNVGPSVAQTSGMGGGGMSGGGMGGGGGTPGGSSSGSGTKPSGTSGTKPSGTSGTRPSGTKPSGTRPTGTGASSSGSSTGRSGDATGGGMGGGGASTSSALTKALAATTTTWAAAVVGDQSAAELELASGKAVIAIGGWSGSDNSPTLAQFEKYVAEGKVRYFIASGSGGGMGGGSGVGSQITSWVEKHYTSTTIGGQTVYDLTSAKSSTSTSS